MANAAKISESEAVEILRYKMKDEGLLVVGQVGNATGGGHSRTADALMIQTWPSRGLSITGVEYKRDRSDWRRELRNGQKAEKIAAYCHYWLVLAPKGIVPIEEVPGGWGLYEIHKTEKMTKLLRTKPPPAKVDPPKPIDYAFLAAILRAREKYQPDRAKIELEVDRRDEIRKNNFEETLKRRTRDLQSRVNAFKEFELASGLDLSMGWRNDRIGENLKSFLEYGVDFWQRIEEQRNGAQRIIETLDSVLAEKPDDTVHDEQNG